MSSIVSPPRAWGHARQATLPVDIEHEQVQLHTITTRQSQPDNLPAPPSSEVRKSPAPRPTSNTNPAPRQSSLPNLLRALAYSSIVLENSGSVARDHLANERTWLAYVRTSLVIAGTGVALVQLFVLTGAEIRALQVDNVELIGMSATVQRFARPLGTTTVFLGLCVLAIGIQRYFNIQRALTQGMFPPARKVIVTLTAALAALVAVTFGILSTLPT